MAAARHNFIGVPPEVLQSFDCLSDDEIREGIKEYS